MATMNLVRENSPSPILLQQAAVAKERLQQPLASPPLATSMTSCTNSNGGGGSGAGGGTSDRNHIRQGIVLTTRCTPSPTPTITTQGVIVAAPETTTTSKQGGNKKTIEPQPSPAGAAVASFTRKSFYATSSGANVSTTNRHTTSNNSVQDEQRRASDRSSTTSNNGQEYGGVWERRRRSSNNSRNGSIVNVEKSSSGDSIIVQPLIIGQQQVNNIPSVDRRSFNSSDDDLLSSRSSQSTIIKRFDNQKNKPAVLFKDHHSRQQSSEKSDSSSINMSDLPSYELASAYIKTNAYAQMNNTKGAASSTTSSTVVTTHQPPYSQGHHHHQQHQGSYDKINQYDQQSPTTPTNQKLPVVASSISSQALNQQPQQQQQQQRQSHLARDSSLEPIGEEERLVQITQAVMNSQPSRSKRAEVLRYFSAARAFQIRVVGGDIQITDTDGCPLFDAYQELDCRQRWWNIEAYGDRVLLMREELSFGDGSSSWGSRVTITDWNGELFGYLITGDPMRLESVERTGIGRLFSQPAVVNNAACSNVTSIPKACWLCQTTGEDGREQSIARLEAYQRVVFLGDGNVGSGNVNQHLNFHFKLMALAGVIRLVGALTVSPVSDCLALTKFFCNCCAYK